MIPTPIFRIPNVLYHYFSLRKSQWLTISEIEKIQRRKLRRVLKHAYENVRFYHQKFDSAGIKPDDIKNIEDLSKIQVSHKHEIQEGFPHHVTANNVNFRRCHSGTTSGSTGLPLTVFQDNKACDILNSRGLRRFLECGMTFRDKHAKIMNPHQSLKPSWFEFLGVKRKLISVFDKVDNHVPTLSDFCPDVISGYSSYIWLLARKVQEIENKRIRPRLVFSSAELLDYEARKTIESIFETEVLDIYGSAEFGPFAWECPEHTGYHIDSESVLVEVLKDGEHVSTGEKGEIVCTNLDNYIMPFIRYNLQDVVIPTDEPCSCGRGLPLIKVIEGRSNDLMVLPSGRLVSPIVVSSAMKKIRWIKRFRVIQERESEFSVKIVTKEGKDHETISQVVEQELSKLFEEDVSIRCTNVNALPREKSGKLRAIISKVRF